MQAKRKPLPDDLNTLSSAAVADLYYTTRAIRLAADKEADVIKTDETRLKDHLINTLVKGEATGTRGKLCSVYVDSKDSYNQESWPEIENWAVKNAKKGGMAIFNRALNKKFVEEYSIVNKGKLPSGVKKVSVVSLHVNKI